MNVFELFFSFVVVAALLKLYAWSMHVGRSSRHPYRAESTAPSSEVPGVPPAATVDVRGEACRTESLLVARLLAGDLAPTDYGRAMSALAAEDAVREPVFVPGDPDF